MTNARRDALWTAGSTVVSAASQLVQIAVLARHVDAHLLGALAIVNVVNAIAILLQDMGLSSYLVHRQDITRRERTSLFMISTGLGLCSAIVLFAVSWPLASFYGSSELGELLRLSTVNFALLGIAAQYQASLIKAFQLPRLARIEVSGRLSGLATLLVLVLAFGASIEAAVYAMIVNSFVRLVCFVAVAEGDWHPGGGFDRAIVRQALRYGAFQLGSQVINQLRSQADQIILGKFLGLAALGVYSLAKELVLQPTKLIMPVVQRLALPRLATRQDDPAALRGLYLTGLRAVSVAAAAVFIMLAVFAPAAVTLLYGQRYAGVSQLIPLMLLFGMLRPLGSLIGALSQSLGRSDIEFGWNLRICGITLLVTVIGAYSRSLEVMAIALAVSQVLATVLSYFFFSSKIIHITPREFFGSWTVESFVPYGFLMLAVALYPGEDWKASVVRFVLVTPPLMWVTWRTRDMWLNRFAQPIGA
ncbi:lipopolysaccharide biosynthesis protein [Luteibacter yeojuensis]|uniref:Lipopolysaccharide biosynthesis protein n=1 Tax=Luteibacter yeojuensis TaxID=345309 RepID=A0A7X5QSK1_9GAMM|nr:lipopolysaccharide biosynthesis protein [Luteibacter yeojuensis]NID14579.1 lipopolysaccharide biosynthesis protein [Luteibacter yeojuensis]